MRFTTYEFSRRGIHRRGGPLATLVKAGSFALETPTAAGIERRKKAEKGAGSNVGKSISPA
jgi:hypothetical protein